MGLQLKKYNSIDNLSSVSLRDLSANVVSAAVRLHSQKLINQSLISAKASFTPSAKQSLRQRGRTKVYTSHFLLQFVLLASESNQADKAESPHGNPSVFTKVFRFQFTQLSAAEEIVSRKVGNV